MVSVNKNHALAFLCMIIALALCVGHIAGNRILIILSMALFLGGIVYTSLKGKVLHLICFFLPWAPLIKFEPETMSIYTVGLIGACLVTWIRYRISFQRNILPAVALIVFTLTVRLFYGLGIDNSFIMFGIMLMLFPIVGKDLHKTYDFSSFLFFFSIGVISAALSAYYLVKYPTIARFIDVFSWSEITRYSGFYGDANFYSAHISAALAGYLIIMGTGAKKMGNAIVMSLILLYCGLLAASKSFIITLVLMLLIWIFQLLFTKKSGSRKILIIILVAALVAAIVASGIFADLFNIIISRFESASNLSELTTGRSTIWMNYLRYLSHNLEVLLFGKGYINALVDGRASHNTILQGVYQFGIVGVVILIAWLKKLFEITLYNVKIDRKQYLQCAILLIGVFLPWMSIDLLFFDEFFLMMFYVSLGFKRISEQKDDVVDKNDLEQ